MMEDRGALPEEDGNQLEYRAMHEENFLSSWLREDVAERKAEVERLSEKAKQQESKSKVFEDFSLTSEVGSFEVSFGFSVLQMT